MGIEVGLSNLFSRSVFPCPRDDRHITLTLQKTVEMSAAKTSGDPNEKRRAVDVSTGND